MRGFGPARSAGGFTLIEVIGALLIFSAGVLMLLQITTGLTRRLEYAALNSLIAVEGQERLDSIGALSYTSLTIGVEVDTMTVRGISYETTQTVSQYTPLVRQAVVQIEPTSGTGPSFDASTFVSEAW